MLRDLETEAGTGFGSGEEGIEDPIRSRPPDDCLGSVPVHSEAPVSVSTFCRPDSVQRMRPLSWR